MYCRMVIGEAVSSGQIGELRSLFMQEIWSEIVKEEGSLGANFMVEEGGNMMIMLTHWMNRENCLKYHCSRAYRQFVAKTQPLLIGTLVVKSFVLIETMNESIRTALHEVGLGHMEEDVALELASIEGKEALKVALAKLKETEQENKDKDAPDSTTA